MNWKNLKDNKCPECRSILLDYPSSNIYKCPTGNFSISYKKFDQIAGNLYKRKKPYVIETDGMLDGSMFDREEINNSFQ